MTIDFGKAVNALALLMFLGLAAWIYYPGLNGPFIFDDYANVLAIKPQSLNWQELLETSLSNESGPLKRPVSNLSFALNYATSGLVPRAYKATNLVLHLLSGCIILLLTRKLLWLLFPGRPARLLAWTAFAVTAAWLLHPLQVSTVLYVVQRMAELSALFTLLALLLYVDGRQRLLNGQRFAYSMILSGILLCGPLALFSKENGALVPLFILATEWMVFGFAAPDARARRRLIGLLSVTCVLPVALGVIVFAINHETLLAGYENRPFSLTDRLLTESRIMVRYLKMMLMPDLSQMGLYHDDYPVQRVLDTSTVIAISGLLVSIAVAFLVRRRAPLAALGIVWFFIAHSMESTILPLELMFEHRNYLALLGPLFVIAQIMLVLLSMPVRESVRRTLSLFPLLVILLLCIMTSLRTESWSSREILLQTMLVNHPDSARIQIELANYDLNSHDYDAARQRVRRIAEIEPWDPGSAFMMVLVSCHQNVYEPDLFRSARVRLDNANALGSMPATLRNVVEKYVRGECTEISTRALRGLVDEALRHPLVADRKRTRQMLFGLEAFLYNFEGDTPAALESFEKAYAANPTGVGPLFGKAYTELNSGALRPASETAERIEDARAGPLSYHGHQLRELKANIADARGDADSGY